MVEITMFNESDDRKSEVDSDWQELMGKDLMMKVRSMLTSDDEEDRRFYLKTIRRFFLSSFTFFWSLKFLPLCLQICEWATRLSLYFMPIWIS